MNNILEKVTVRITFTLVITLTPFIFYMLYVYLYGYRTISITTVFTSSMVILLDLIMLLFYYSKIYKAFSTGFLATYQNNGNTGMDDTLSHHEKILSELTSELNNLNEKLENANNSENYSDLLKETLDVVKEVNRLNDSDVAKILNSLTEVIKAVNLIYFYMLLMFVLGISATIDIFLKNINGSLVILALSAVVAIFIFIKVQRNKTCKILYSVYD